MTTPWLLAIVAALGRLLLHLLALHVTDRGVRNWPGAQTLVKTTDWLGLPACVPASTRGTARR